MSVNDDQSCVICSKNPRRKHGVECRLCYQRNHLRKQRLRSEQANSSEIETNPRLQVLSLEQAARELEYIQHRNWLNKES